MRQITIIIALGVFLFTSGTAMAIRCGNTFIKPGVKTIEVLDACGEPRAKEEIKAGGRSGKSVERWTYGPFKGNYYFLYFKAGTLERVESKKK